MDLLKAEIERKKKAVALAKSSSDGGAPEGRGYGKKRVYLKASAFRKLQDQADRGGGSTSCEGEGSKKRRRAEGGSAPDDASGRAQAGNLGPGGDSPVGKGANEHEYNGRDQDHAAHSSKDARKGKKESSSDRKKGRNYDDGLSGLTQDQVTAQLRGMGLPVWLFGEKTEGSRLGRLREAIAKKKDEMAGVSEMDEFRLGSGHGIRNQFLGRGTEDEAASGGVGASAAGATAGRRKEDHDFGDRDSQKRHEEGGSKVEADGDIGEDDDPHKKIHRFFKSLLRRWEDDLTRRADSDKRTFAGRNDTKTYKQCKDYIRPLFKQCKNRRLEPAIMAHLLNIIKCCEDGEFVRANDAYMDLAIGRAAWPIGVTMVGIHARSGREKIGSANVAHVMNNELQRKYLTSVKRLMTYCQSKRPDVDPSKKVVMR